MTHIYTYYLGGEKMMKKMVAAGV